MSNAKIKLNCSFNKNHLVCSDPVFLKCLKCQPACLNCIVKASDYSGTFKCPACKSEHKRDGLTQDSHEDYFKEFKSSLKQNCVQSLLKGDLLKNGLDGNNYLRSSSSLWV